MDRRSISNLLLAWLAMIAWDFLLHGGLLASFYVGDSQFLLEPLKAFVRIPLGYLAFLLLAFMLQWLMPGNNIDNERSAINFGLRLGALTWGALLIGLFSISTIQINTAISWFIGQSLAMGLGAWVLYKAQLADSLRPLTIRVLGFLVLAFILTILLQSFGLAPQIVI